MAKEELIYTRISSNLKDRLAIEAHNRGEAEAVIVREALNEYFVRRSNSTGLSAAGQLLDAAGALARGAPSATPGAGTPVKYTTRRRSKKKPAKPHGT